MVSARWPRLVKVVDEGFLRHEFCWIKVKGCSPCSVCWLLLFHAMCDFVRRKDYAHRNCNLVKLLHHIYHLPAYQSIHPGLEPCKNTNCPTQWPYTSTHPAGCGT